MEKLQINNYELRDGCYMKDDVKMTNFTLAVKKIMRKGGGADYQFEVDFDGQRVSDVFTTAQINRQRFLKDMSVFIEDETEFYKLLRRAVFEKTFAEDEVLYQTNCNGLQEVNGKWMYVYTNGSIGKDGFHSEVYSGIEGMYLPEDAVLDLEQNKEIIERLFREYNSNSEVFYPLFLTNVMAITNGYFRKIGEENFMKLTLWLDGKSGSGKTELAKAVGTYTFNDNGLSKRIVSVTGRRHYALNCLAESSGSVCILDDVKNEAVRERKNSVKNTIDDYIRSVFQGRLTDCNSINSKPQYFDACAIITGEYLDTNESQNARMLYLKVSGFLKDDQNSKALRVLQQNPMWLTSVCIGYIQWLINMMDESSFPQLLINKLTEMRNKTKPYKGLNNAERLNESMHMIEMAQILAKMYFEHIGMPENFNKRFESNSMASIRMVCDNTFYLLGGEQMIVLDALKNIFLQSNVRRAAYVSQRCYSVSYHQQYFCIDKYNDDFVWIEDYGKSLLQKGKTENGQYDGQTCLIIREEKLTKLLDDQIKIFVKENQISSRTADKILNNLLMILRKMQIIFKQYRSDSKWGRPALNYPVYTTRNEERYEEFDYTNFCQTTRQVKVYEMDCEPVIQINAEHPCALVLKEKITNMEVGDGSIVYRSDYHYEGMDENDICKVRKAFINNKSLYRE